MVANYGLYHSTYWFEQGDVDNDRLTERESDAIELAIDNQQDRLERFFGRDALKEKVKARPEV